MLLTTNCVTLGVITQENPKFTGTVPNGFLLGFHNAPLWTLVCHQSNKQESQTLVLPRHKQQRYLWHCQNSTITLQASIYQSIFSFVMESGRKVCLLALQGMRICEENHINFMAINKTDWNNKSLTMIKLQLGCTKSSALFIFQTTLNYGKDVQGLIYKTEIAWWMHFSKR